MRVANYHGVVTDQPFNARVAAPNEGHSNMAMSAPAPNMMDSIMSRLNSSYQVPVASVPAYDKG